MRPVSMKRKLVEEELHEHVVRRGFLGVWHFENMPRMVKFFKFFMRFSCTRQMGIRNAIDIKVENARIIHNDLPSGFDNTRILLITDLHVDGIDILAEKIISTIDKIDYDFCILGGDYSFGHKQQGESAHPKMRLLAAELTRKSRVFGVLGNHDMYSMAKVLGECGVEMLINEGVRLEKHGDEIYLAGLDDCHYYGADNITLADSQADREAFKIVVCHSPERYKEAAEAGYRLYLAGHTHGGQICLPGGLAVVTNATVPREMLKGKWRCQKMIGYTSRGVGSSGIAVRFSCPPEITLITLRGRR